MITKVGAENIRDIDDFCDAIEEVKEREKASVEVLRKGATQKLQLTIDHDNDVSSHFDFNISPDDDDIVIDLETDGERKHIRIDGDKIRRETEKLKRHLEELRDDVHDGMIELRDKLHRELDRIHDAVIV